MIRRPDSCAERWKTASGAALYQHPAGVPGNDDCGQISTWFVFAALGFYPVTAVTGVYVLGSPLVNHATLRVPGTRTTFTIVAENNSEQNIYVQSVELNGKPLTRSWIVHAEIVAGGELRFRMGRRCGIRALYSSPRSTTSKPKSGCPDARPDSYLRSRTVHWEHRDMSTLRNRIHARVSCAEPSAMPHGLGNVHCTRDLR